MLEPYLQYRYAFWNVSVQIILVLSVLNVLLMLRLLHNGCTKIYLEPRTIQVTSTSPEPTATHEMREDEPEVHIFDVDPRLGRWDATRQYKMIDHALVGASYIELSANYSVCLATQTSVEKMNSLVHTAHHWSGPISAALFVAGDEDYAIVQEYVKFIRKCFPKVGSQLSFHLAFPKELVPSSSPPRKEISKWDCRRSTIVLQGLLNQRSLQIKKWHHNNRYPQNHMRNLARKNCQSPQVFLTDVDVIPSFGSAKGLNEFFKTVNCDKCAYVIPTYEVSYQQPFPKSKSEVVHLSRVGLARPFHRKIFLYNSFATNYSRWEKDIEETPVHVSHKVGHLKFYYEPFYISADSVPPHDERFVGYGLTKNTQVYEMFVAGYEFYVLSPVFSVHWGLQNNIKRPDWRERQANENYRKLHVFKREIFARHNYLARLRAATASTTALTTVTAKETVPSTKLPGTS